MVVGQPYLLWVKWGPKDCGVGSTLPPVGQVGAQGLASVPASHVGGRS